MNELEPSYKPSSSTALALSPRFAAAYRQLHYEAPSQSALYACLEQLLKLFTGMCAGLARFLDPGRPEISALASSLDRPLQYERLLRFSLNLLRHHESQTAQQALLEVFFPRHREEGGLPLHTAWLQLGSEVSPLPPLSRWETEAADPESLLPRYWEVLESWVQAALPLLQNSQWVLGLNPRTQLRDVQAWRGEGLTASIPLIPPCPWDAEGSTETPDPPEWSPQWSRPMADRIVAQMERSFPDLVSLHPPSFLLRPTQHEIDQQSSCYFLLEGPDGCGKSLALASLGIALGPDLELLHFPVRGCFRGDFQTLIEEVDEGIQMRLDGELTRMVPLGPLVIQELNRRYSGGTAAEKFQAYLSQLVLRNGQRFVLALDGLDEAFEGGDSGVSMADYLPDQLPDGVFLLLAYRGDGCSARLQRRLTQLQERGAFPLQFPVNSPAHRRWSQDILQASGISSSTAMQLVSSGYPLLVARLLGQGLSTRLLKGMRWPSPERVLGELFGRLEQEFGEPFLRLLMVLATSYSPVPLEELSDLGFDPRMTLQLLELVPALFLASRPTAKGGWQLQLAHEQLRLHLQEHYSHRYSETCQRLASRAAHQLLQRPTWSSAELDVVHAGSFRLDCLYRWLFDAQNLALTESVVTSQALRQFRNEVCANLEQRGRFHHKLSILQGLRSCLEMVLEHRDSNDLLDELAWAYNSRGLTFLHLGQFHQALGELALAERHFRKLVEERRLVHHRNGLASALNRRSEALRALGQLGEAWECAHQSVEQHRLTLEEGGPLHPRLGLARALAQRARCAADHSLWPRALTDLEEALQLLEKSSAQAQSRANATDIAAHFNEWVKALIVRAGAYRAVGEHENSLVDLDQALLLTHHLEEAQGLDWSNTKAPEVQVLQARAYEALQGFEEALDAYDEAISGFGQQVRQGRLDLRLHLAEAYHSRAELRHLRKKIDSAMEDYTRSLALQAQLIECEEQADLRPFRAQTYQGRGNCLGQLTRRREALQDYDKAIEDFLYGLNSGKLQQADLRRLASVYFESGRLHLDLGEASQAADRAANAIRLLDERLNSPPEELAQAHLLQAQALYHLSNYQTGLESASTAIQVLSLRVRGDSGKLERHLASAHRLRAELACCLGDHPQALKDFGLALHLFGGESLEPDRIRQAEVLYRRAELQGKLNEFEAALDDIQAALDLLSDSPPEATGQILGLRRLRIRILGHQGHYPVAISDLAHLLDELRGRPDQAQQHLDTLLELMGYQARLEQWPDLSILYSEFLKVRESAPQAHLAPGVEALFEQIENQSDHNSSESSRMARADVLVALARMLSQLQPERASLLQARALHQRGRVRLANQRVTEALEDFSEAVAQVRSGETVAHPELLVQLYADRAEGLLRAGLQARAQRDMDEAVLLLQRNPGGPRLTLLARLVTQKCQLLRREGQFAQSVSEFNQCMAHEAFSSLGPDITAWMYLGRALAHDKLGNTELALSDYREAAQLLTQMEVSQDPLPIQERLRCRLRLLHLDDPSHGNFLVYCAEDSLVCLSRLRALSPALASQWVVVCLHTWQGLPPALLSSRLIGDATEELSHFLSGLLNADQCGQLSRILVGLAGQLGPAQAERLLGVVLPLLLGGPREHLTESLLDFLTFLFRLYQSHPEHQPTFQLQPALQALAEIQQQCPPDGQLGVGWNNLMRAWLTLPENQLLACGASRNQLQSLRLW